MVKIYVSFRQKGGMMLRSIVKEIELAAVPPPGSYFEYEDGWGLAYVAPYSERGVHLEITGSGISISGYGPQFSPDEIESLQELGWRVG